MTWKSDLTKAISAEVAAEKAATQAEDERRRTWWDTTWALAAVPRAQWAEAQELYVKKTEHNKSTAEHRRRTGVRLPQTALESGLPQPRFAEAAANWIGKDGDHAKVKEAVKFLRDAEKNAQSLREFSQMLTGKPWTLAPENLTEADEDAVVEKVAKTRPAAIAKNVTPRVARAIIRDKAASSAVRDATEEESRDMLDRIQSRPHPKLPDPDDLPEDTLSALEVAALITEFSIVAGDAETAGRKAYDIHQRVQRFLTSEQVTDLADWSDGPSDIWTMVRESIIGGGVTDDALQDLINQEQN